MSQAVLQAPAYHPSDHDVGIVHIGLGAFHRAHQAVYTDDVLAQFGGDWRILGVNLRSTQIVDTLNAQNGKYTLVVRSDAPDKPPLFREIGSIAGALAAARGAGPVLDALLRPQTRIVSLTITEKGYGVDVATGALSLDDPTIAADLAAPQNPKGAIGLIVRALQMRRAAGVGPFTVMSCDNLPKNGHLTRLGVVEFARRVDPALADWIDANVSFPSTMVDRITPASTDALLRDVERHIGHPDPATVETEPFSQWVIEDNFCAGRPQWDQVGALLASDVEPFEHMKLRMLNGAHSMLAYAGFLSGCAYVRDVMAHPALAALVERHMVAARATLSPLQGVDFEEYAQALLQRFRNPNIAHETYQIAMDGSQKMPQRIFEPALDALRGGHSIDAFAFATAGWIRYTGGAHDTGEGYALRDPREGELSAINRECGDDPDALLNAVCALPNLVPLALSESDVFKQAVRKHLDRMITHGMANAVAKANDGT